MIAIPLTSADAAIEYATRGWAPIPSARRSKNPNRPGWQNERWTEEAIRQNPAKFGNVGINLGASGLSDVDLDCLEALLLAQQFLPPTGAIFGRASTPRSHELYNTRDAIVFKQFEDVDGSMLVELRGRGHPKKKR